MSKACYAYSKGKIVLRVSAMPFVVDEQSKRCLTSRQQVGLIEFVDNLRKEHIEQMKQERTDHKRYDNHKKWNPRTRKWTCGLRNLRRQWEKLEEGHSIYNGLNGIIQMKSTWEVLFAELLDYLRLHWRYEPKQYLMSFEDMMTPKYTPDFWVEEFNCYFEVKGYARGMKMTIEENMRLAVARAKICEYLHGVKVVVLGGQALELLGLWNEAFLKKKVVIEKLECFRVA